jgi:amino acid permease
MTNSTVFSVPLCYIYPPMLHYKAIARTRKEKTLDILLFIFGIIATIYTTVQTIAVRNMRLRSTLLNFADA